MSNIESKVADAILQRTEEIKIGGRTYMVAPPSIATLIMVSEAVSRLPKLELDKENPVVEVLRTAKDCTLIGEILAILILGAKAAGELEKSDGLLSVFRGKTGRATRKDVLTREILENMSPQELNLTLTGLLSKMQIGDFFGVTTFLSEVNLTKPTKVVTTETTASGQ